MTFALFLLAVTVLGGTIAWFVMRPDLQQLLDEVGQIEGLGDATGKQTVDVDGAGRGNAPQPKPLDRPTTPVMGLDFSSIPFVELADSVNVLDWNRDCTVECWIRWPEMPVAPQFLVGTLDKPLEGSESGWALRCTPLDKQLYFEFYLARGDKRAARLAMPPLAYSRRWFHVAATRQDNVMRIFVDGTPLKAVRFGEEILPNELPIQLGASPRLHPSIGLAAEMTVIRISNAARYSDTFTPAKTLTKDDATLALVRFDRPQDGRYSDLSGNGHDGRIGGVSPE